ncbi:hypothetical protein YC2023_025382 [Brassica napus]
MDSSPVSGRLDIFEIYRRFCEIRSSQGLCNNIYKPPYEASSPRANYLKEALTQLLTLVENKFQARNSIFDELFKLMSRLDLMVDFSEFRRFYDFVFFMCRENGQKSITVGRAITAWKLVLVGRFRKTNGTILQKILGNKSWCLVVVYMRILKDMTPKVLRLSSSMSLLSRCTGLEQKKKKKLTRILGPRKNTSLSCNCGDRESESCLYEDPLSDEHHKDFRRCNTGLRSVPGLKRKTSKDYDEEEVSENEYAFSSPNMKRIRSEDSPGCSSKTHCAIERSLSQGFASLLSTGDES